jgi:hypothetical protein
MPRRFQFSLRRLLVATTLVAIASMCFAHLAAVGLRQTWLHSGGMVECFVGSILLGAGAGVLSRHLVRDSLFGLLIGYVTVWIVAIVFGDSI